MTRPMQALLLGVALSLLGQAAIAAPLEYVGQPDKTLAVMDNYGVGVPTSRGLRTIVPQGWKTYIEPAAKVPETISWTIGQSWTGVLSDLAASGDLTVLVDWQDKAVYVRSVSGGLEQDAKRAELLQAATTPLPSFGEAPPSKKTQAEPQSLYAVPTAGASYAAANPAGVARKPAAAPEVLADATPASQAAAPVAAPAAVEVSPTFTVAKSAVLGTVALAQFPESGKDASAAAQATSAPVTVPGQTQTAALPHIEAASNLPAQVGEPAPQAIAKAALTSVEAKAPATASAATAAATTPMAGPAAAPAAPASTTSPAAVPLQSAAARVVSEQVSQGVVQALAAAPTSLEAAFVKPGNTDDFVYTQPVALNKPSARTTAQGIANRFHLRLVWAAPEIQMKGPVTLLGNSPDEDAMLLGKALGVFSPVNIEVPAGQGVLLVTAKNGQYADLAAKPMPVRVEPTEVVQAALAPAPVVAEPVAAAAAPADVAPVTADAAVPPAAAPVALVDVSTEQSPQGASVASAQQAPQSAPAVQTEKEVPKLALVLRAGEPLEVAIVRLAREQGFTVEWKVEGGFEAKHELTYRGNTLSEVLNKVLPALGVSADIYKTELHIIVRPADAALDR
ncbi:Toxin co-regulated pilus biosynthesis protein Q [compost metagenome]